MASREELIKYAIEKVNPTIGFVPIYEVVLFEKLRELVTNDGKGSGMADTSHFNNMGFYYELDSAIDAMHENRCDIRETVFIVNDIETLTLTVQVSADYRHLLKSK